MLHIRNCDRVISHLWSSRLATTRSCGVVSLEHKLGVIISSCATVFSLWWYFASCWLGYHLFCLSGVEVDFGGGHHEYLAVDMQGIVAAVGGAAALFLGEIVTAI